MRSIRTRALAGLLAAGALTLSACGSTATTEATTVATAVTADTVTATTAGGTTTELSAGTVTVTIDGQQVELSGAYVVDGVDATITGGSYASTTVDQAVFLVVNCGSLTITDATIDKSGSPAEVGDAYNFYGLNSAVVVVGEGSSVAIAGSTISTTSDGSNAVVATLTATATVSDTTITTTGDSSRGLHATYEGVITGTDVDISTQGAHSATLATDRGNGTVTLTGGTLSTAGDGSPIIYSTGDISVDGTTGTATGSEAIVVEGKNHVVVTDSTLSTTFDNAIMMYQSFSGDAADQNAVTTTSTLEVTGSTITAGASNAFLFVTNTSAEATFTDSVLANDGSTTFVLADEGRWGTSGSNGGDLTLMLAGSTAASGSVSAGSTSAVEVTLTGGATLTGDTSGSVTVADA